MQAISLRKVTAIISVAAFLLTQSGIGIAAQKNGDCPHFSLLRTMEPEEERRGQAAGKETDAGASGITTVASLTAELRPFADNLKATFSAAVGQPVVAAGTGDAGEGAASASAVGRFRIPVSLEFAVKLEPQEGMKLLFTYCPENQEINLSHGFSNLPMWRHVHGLNKPAIDMPDTPPFLKLIRHGDNFFVKKVDGGEIIFNPAPNDIFVVSKNGEVALGFKLSESEKQTFELVTADYLLNLAAPSGARGAGVVEAAASTAPTLSPSGGETTQAVKGKVSARAEGNPPIIPQNIDEGLKLVGQAILQHEKLQPFIKADWVTISVRNIPNSGATMLAIEIRNPAVSQEEMMGFHIFYCPNEEFTRYHTLLSMEHRFIDGSIPLPDADGCVNSTMGLLQRIPGGIPRRSEFDDILRSRWVRWSAETESVVSSQSSVEGAPVASSGAANSAADAGVIGAASAGNQKPYSADELDDIIFYLGTQHNIPSDFSQQRLALACLVTGIVGDVADETLEKLFKEGFSSDVSRVLQEAAGMFYNHPLTENFIQAITIQQTSTGHAFYIHPQAPSETILALAFLLSQHPNMHFVIFADRVTKERLITLNISNITEQSIIELPDDGEIRSEMIERARGLFGEKITDINCYCNSQMLPSGAVVVEGFHLRPLNEVNTNQDLLGAFIKMGFSVSDNTIDDEKYKAFQMAQALARAV